MKLKLKDIQKSKNVAELLEEEELAKIGSSIIRGYELDEESRAEWFETIEKAMDIAKQTHESKNHPFPNAANVKYPLISQAVIDFASRTYPEVIQNDKVVKISVIGQDPTGEKFKRAHRVSRFMSYQLLQASPEWEDGVDKLLHILPLLGTVFKKTYYDPILGRPVSEVCKPDRIVVNYNIKCLESARRITHLMSYHVNDIIERIRSGLYLDIDVEELHSAEGYHEDEDGPLTLLEQHCYLDLDGDGYQEPYVVVVHKESHQVLRIVPRFKKVKKNKKKEVIRIEPEQYFTDFHFIKSPDGGFYSTGLGTLLYPLNATINTLINQLIDSGTLNNSQSGFLGRGLRLKNGEFKLRLGEWRVLDAAPGINLQQNIVPMPTKEPSPTLFQLLGLLVDVGKELISKTDIMSGQGQTQNVAASTVLAMVEQGMKVFNAINKRLYRAFKAEFKLIYDLNREYIKDKDYKYVLDDPKAEVNLDFDDESYDICPVADPAMASDAQRLAKAQAIMGVPGVDPYIASKYFLDALQLDEQTVNLLLPPPNPQAPPPPEAQKTLAEVDKLRAEARALIMEAQVLSEKQLIETTKVNIQRDEALVRSEESAARIMKMKQDALTNAAKMDLVKAKADHQAKLAELDMLHKREKDEVDLSIRAADVAQKADNAAMKIEVDRGKDKQR